LIYVSAIAGVVHYIWLVKADLRKPLEYAAVLTVLLGYRLLMHERSAALPTEVRDRAPLSAARSES
jgi:sulfoxide reductase heme-binding subunit YedZ